MIISDIIAALERVAPLDLQEGYDNAGLQIGNAAAECRGALLCVDVTPAVVEEAREKGCNLIISHHPLFFKGVKQLTGATIQQEAAIAAIKNDIAVYSAHTNLDNAPEGVNRVFAEMLGLSDIFPLIPQPQAPGSGSGAIGNFAQGVTVPQLIERVKKACNSPIVRCTTPPEGTLTRIALCGGSGGSFIQEAIASGAQAYVTSDVRYHDFVDFASKIFLIDIGHYESEKCTKDIFYHIVSKIFPNFALYYSEKEKNPINYL